MSQLPAEIEVELRPFRDGDREQVVRLWREAELTIPANDPNRDIDYCRGSGHGEVFVAALGEDIVGTIMAGHDGHRGWLYYVAASAEHRRQGVGRRLVRHAEAWLATQGVPKLNLLIRSHNAQVQVFYEKLGYAIEPRICMARRLDGATQAKPTLTAVRTYLEMRERSRLFHPPRPAAQLAVLRAHPISVPFYRFLYNTVGAPWLWYERRQMSDEALTAHLNDPGIEVYVLYVGGQPAGFAELDKRALPPDIELAYFGLLPEFIGRGLGPFFLKLMIDQAWQDNPERLWVHSCNLDHPKAIQLYQRAGFVPYRQESLVIDDPRPLG